MSPSDEIFFQSKYEMNGKSDVSQDYNPSISLEQAQIGSYIRHGQRVPILGRHVHFVGPFPKDDGIRECAVPDWKMK